MGRGQKAQRAGKSSAVKGCVTPHLGSTPLHVRALAPPHLPPRKDPRRALLWALLHFTLYLVPFHSRPFYRHCVLDSGPTLTVYSKVSTWKACSCRGRRLCWWPFDMLGVTAAVGFTLQTIWGSHVCFPILVFCLFVCFLPWPIFYILAFFDRRQRVKRGQSCPSAGYSCWQTLWCFTSHASYSSPQPPPILKTKMSCCLHPWNWTILVVFTCCCFFFK